MSPEIGQADVFISHAHEDKEEVARPLAEELRRRGLTVWYDDFVLELGDSLREVIERGLGTARFGIVILSPSFFDKEWPQRELSALLARETSKRTKILLPVWHKLTLDEVVARSPLLADRLAVSTARGLPFVVDQILAASAAKPARPRPEPPPRNSAPQPGKPVPRRPASRRLAFGALLTLALLTLLVATAFLWQPWKSAAKPAQPPPGQERVQKVKVDGLEVDGPVLVYVPGGEYVLGADDISENEKPVHRVVLSPFWIGKYEVMNEQYGHFLRAVPGAARPAFWNEALYNRPRQPVVGVSWEEARAYCRWAGLALPSEAQWEAAARGTDRRRYPWGKEEPTPERANYTKGRPTDVGSFPPGAGPFGTLDQAGNVWEWCADVWDEKAYRKREGVKDPVGTRGDATLRCLRGGSWLYPAEYLAAACRYRNRASSRNENIGFRCLLGAR